MECDNRFYLYTGHKFLCTISSTSVTIKKSPLSNFRIVSEQGRTKDLKTQNWQLYKSPERASAVSTNIWGDQPSRRSGSGFIVFGSEAWVPATSLCVWKSISCLLSLIPKICLSFLLLLLGSAPGEFWVVWVDSAWHCMSPCLQWPMTWPAMVSGMVRVTVMHGSFMEGIWLIAWWGQHVD